LLHQVERGKHGRERPDSKHEVLDDLVLLHDLMLKKFVLSS
jgi:hypothetical protein